MTPTVTSIAGKRVYTSKDDIICVQLPDVLSISLLAIFGMEIAGNGLGRPPKFVDQEQLPEDRKDNSGDVDDTDSDSDEQGR